MLFTQANESLSRRAEALSHGAGRTIQPAVFGQPGASETALNAVETALGAALPDDLRYLAAHTSDPDDQIFGWIENPGQVTEFREWVFDGICSEITGSLFWLSAWGERPEDECQRLEIFENAFDTWPRLIPLTGQRALAIDPADEGNPVFSIMQTDVQCVGTDLADWMARDLILSAPDDAAPVDLSQSRHIRIWSDFARNTEGFVAQQGLYPEDEAAVQALFDRVLKRGTSDR